MSKRRNSKYTYYPGRIRSILRGETTTTQISMHVNESNSMKEGDISTDDYNYEWLVKRSPSGELYREKQSKLEGARTPFWCPKCKRIMKGRHDTKMYQTQGMCINCVIDRDTQMKIDGTYNDYEKRVILSRAKGFLMDSKKEIGKYLDETSPEIQFVEKDGSIEKWDVDVTQMKEFLTKELCTINEELDKIEKIESGEIDWIWNK